MLIWLEMNIDSIVRKIVDLDRSGIDGDVGAVQNDAVRLSFAFQVDANVTINWEITFLNDG